MKHKNSLVPVFVFLGAIYLLFGPVKGPTIMDDVVYLGEMAGWVLLVAAIGLMLLPVYLSIFHRRST